LVTEALSAQVLLFQSIHLKSCGSCVTERSSSIFSSVKQVVCVCALQQQV